jgi:alpha-D-ribose 1-methylphosphonate 5-triphosphate synthase subunit PhnG
VLSAARQSAKTLRVLADRPMGLLRYAWAELECLEAPALRRAIELGLEAVRGNCGQYGVKPR